MSPKNRTRGLTGLALLCTAAVAATSALADETRESIHVSYVAADLTRPEGAAALYRHIRRAAKQVCHQPDIRNVAAYSLYEECFERAVDAAVANVDSTALTALHHSRTHGSPG